MNQGPPQQMAMPYMPPMAQMGAGGPMGAGMMTSSSSLQDEAIRALIETKTQAKDREIQGLMAMVDEKNAEVKRLSDENDQNSMTINRYKTQYEENNLEVQRLSNKLQNLRAKQKQDIQNYQQQIEDKDRELKIMSDKIEEVKRPEFKETQFRQLYKPLYDENTNFRHQIDSLKSELLSCRIHLDELKQATPLLMDPQEVHVEDSVIRSSHNPLTQS